jgi:predicted metal-dependent phosphoesterase TrpH
MLRGDFHMHTSYSHDCATDPKALVERCMNVGLNCIAVTDHNSIQGALEVQRLSSNIVIIGEEIKTTDGEITGLFLQQEIRPGLRPMETVMLIKEQGGIVSIPHPFDRLGRSPLPLNIMEEIMPHVSIIEAFNARTRLSRDSKRSREFGMAHNLLMTAVSDAHTLRELGKCYTELPDFDGSADGFKYSLRNARLIEHRSKPWVHVFSTLNKLRRKMN